MSALWKDLLDQYLDSPPCQQGLRPFLKFLLGRHKAQGGVTEIRIGPGPDRADFGSWLEVLVPTVPYADVAWAAARGQALADWLAREHATEDVKITSVAPGAHCPLPGTLLVLGKSTNGRPHRFVELSRPDQTPE